tara:strand:+ start:17405 stop:19000 length:1596 start_codon:yes stop_codon:yes gene_type:complete
MDYTANNFARIIVEEGNSYGECLGNHNLPHAATQAAHKDCNKHGHNSVIAISTESKLTVGEKYPELADQYHADRTEQIGIRLMIEVLEAREGKGCAKLSAQNLDIWDYTVETLEAKYLEPALAKIESDKIEAQKRAESLARQGAIQSQLESDQEAFCYRFPAVSGQMSGRGYYTAQIPYSALTRIFVFDEDTVPPELRAQRVLNETRAQKIADYIVGNFRNGSGYVLPAITASVDTAVTFNPIQEGGMGQSLGQLSIPMTSTLLINDGQHRRKGIELAMKETPSLQNETIAVTIFFDRGLKRSQQIFADINANAARVSTALNMLYDQRDAYGNWLKEVLNREDMSRIKSRIDFEKNSIAAKSSKLWSLVSFKKLIDRMYGSAAKNAAMQNNTEELDRIGNEIAAFFSSLSGLTCWDDMLDYKIPAVEIREHQLIGHTVFLEALGMVASNALESQVSWTEMQDGLRKVPVGKLHPMWKSRCVTVAGKMNKTADGVKATAGQIMAILGMPMPPELAELHKRILAEQTPSKVAS